MSGHLRVANPPPKPLMLFDGDCHFCRRWIARWHETTGDRVEYKSSQEAGAEFPEIAPEEFARAVQVVDTDGRVYSGAAAVFQSLGYKPNGSLLAWCAAHVPGFAALSEVLYGLVARNRQVASLGTRLLWGNDVRRPSYFATREIFVRSLGLVFLIAFVSLWLQIDGLIGSHGISPVAQFLPLARDEAGSNAVWVLPTLCWLNTSDAFLHLLCASGVLFSILLIAGAIPAAGLFIAYVCYLSLTIAGQMFLSFQWDILLLETGFFAIFFAPWRWRFAERDETPVSRVALFLLKLLLFKLMFMSGVVKLTSGDSSWAGLTAMNYHYETQPLPTVFGWWAFQAPEAIKRATTAATLAIELVAPFFIWMPRRFRVIGFALFTVLQIGIGLTGNYAFFNLLTVVLSLLLLDDKIWRRHSRVAPNDRSLHASRYGAWAVLIVTVPLTAFHIWQSFKPEMDWPAALSAIYQRVEPFRVANGYGLFRVMTKKRPEIVIEGSADGVDWLPYSFRWKPGGLNQPPLWVQPHQPRLDWQMWFAALGSARSNPWFLGLAQGLLTNSAPIVRLLENNPFPEKPPRFLRATLFEYHFTSAAERRATGNWWKREEKREYMRPISLRGE